MTPIVEGNVELDEQQYVLVEARLEFDDCSTETQAMQHARRNEVYRDVGSEWREPDAANFIEIVFSDLAETRRSCCAPTASATW